MIVHEIHSFAILFSCVLCSLPQGSTSVQGSSDLILEVEVEKRFSLADEMPFTVVLSAKKDQVVTTLDTATLEFQLKRLTPGATKGSVCGDALLANTKAVVTRSAGGQDLIETIILPQRKVTVRSGQKLRRALQLSEVFDRRYGPGVYVLTVQYESKAVAEARFKVVVDDKESVPALIDLIESDSFETRVWARNSLFILTGHPSWSPRKTDGRGKIGDEVQKLRTWWAGKKSLLELPGKKRDPERASESTP